MTNWMTAAGLALIAGGLATLISFRTVIFGGGSRRCGRRRRTGAPARPRRTARPVGDAAPADRRRRLAAAFSGRPQEYGLGRDPEESGLASIGLADDDTPIRPAEEPPIAPFSDVPPPGFTPDVPPPGFAPDRPPPGFSVDEPSNAVFIQEPPRRGPDLPPVEPPAPRRTVDRSDHSYGDRIDDWVRPEYREPVDQPPAGEYWTPVPDGRLSDPEPSARGYGWPIPVDRLPPVPAYEPATGFDLSPVQAAEPTTVVPVWPPASEGRRIRLPRAWSQRDVARSPAEKPRPRPRPRPVIPDAAYAVGPDPGCAVGPDATYVSRHAADPPH